MCLSPYTVSFMRCGKRYSSPVPCGKCLECIESYQDSWSIRLCDEAKEWKYAYFVTFTFSNDRIPLVDMGNFDHIDDIKKGLSRLRKTKEYFRAVHFGYGSYLLPELVGTVKIPYVDKSLFRSFDKRAKMNLSRYLGVTKGFLKRFVCSEYGPSTLRPHYHGLYFTDVPPLIFYREYLSYWTFGHIDWKTISIDHDRKFSDVAAYVSKYCCKPSFIENPYVTYGVLPRPFRLISHGIGKKRMETLSFEFKRLIENRPILPDGLGYKNTCESKLFIESLYNKLIFYKLDEKKGKVFKIRMPRYYRDACLCNRYTLQDIEELKSRYPWQSFTYDQVGRYNTNTSIQVALMAYILEKHFELYNTQYRELQALYPERSPDEIHFELLCCEKENLVRRKKSSEDRLFKFYSKTKIN